MSTLQICYPAVGIILAIVIFVILFTKLCVDAIYGKKYAVWTLVLIAILAVTVCLVAIYFNIASAFC